MPNHQRRGHGIPPRQGDAGRAKIIGFRTTNEGKYLRKPGMKVENGRGGEIRTHDLLYPKQARYQATLRPDN